MRRSTLVSIVTIGFAVASAATALSDVIFRYIHRTPHIIGVPDAGARSLRRLVPRGETLGFITDANDREASDRRLHGVAYSLAPLIVERTADRPFVIGDFRSQANISIALSGHRLRVVGGLGNGFILFAAW
jgi:hypothetical protein